MDTKYKKEKKVKCGVENYRDEADDAFLFCHEITRPDSIAVHPVLAAATHPKFWNMATF